MLLSVPASLALLSGQTVARICTIESVPVTISVRQGIFDIDLPITSLDATTLAQNITQQGRNFTELVTTGYQTVEGTYDISAQYCRPDDDTNSDPTVQVLTHGIGFDKAFALMTNKK